LAAQGKNIVPPTAAAVLAAPADGDYRIFFDVEGDIIVIRRIGDRKQIYD